jgi:hypothetical protein
MLCRGTLSSRFFGCHGVVKGNALEL